MKTFLFMIFGAIIGLQGCKKNDPRAYDSVMGKVHLQLKGPDGADLLNPDNQSCIKETNTNLYYLLNNEKVKYFNRDQDQQKGILIRKDPSTNQYILEVLLNLDVADGEITTNILEYENYEPDTLKIRVRKTDRSMYYDQLWINGEEIILNENHSADIIVKTPKI